MYPTVLGYDFIEIDLVEQKLFKITDHARPKPQKQLIESFSSCLVFHSHGNIIDYKSTDNILHYILQRTHKCNMTT